MKLNIAKVLLASALVLCAQRAMAQPFSIDRFTVAGGGGPSTGGTFALSGTVGQHDVTPQPTSGGSFSLKGGFWSPFDVPLPRVPITIFDNIEGINNGNLGATATIWRAGKFCLGSQPYQLESVALPLKIFDLNVRTSPVRLQIFSNDAASGKPFASTGAIMNLSGMTNPITSTQINNGTLVTWTPATPFTLAANKCYWAVLSVESGADVNLTGSQTIPTGEASAKWTTSSANAGASWDAPDNFTNYKMLIRGTASAPPPALAVNAVGISGNELRFNFPTIAGETYAIESRSNLMSAAWAEVPGTRQTSAGAAFAVSLPIRQSQPQQFYRVKQLP